MVFKENFKVELEDMDNKKMLTNKALLKYLENVGADQSSKVGYRNIRY